MAEKTTAQIGASEARAEAGGQLVALTLGGGGALHEVKRQLNEFRSFVKEILQPGIDYGHLDGVDRDFLFKAGAERICQLYNLAPRIIYDERTEDFRADPPFFRYLMRVQLIHRPTGQLVGEGVGEANSMESKYRYRTEWWNGRGDPSGTGWERTKSGKLRRRIDNHDTADLPNTLVKMAKKRALVDAAITVAAASEFFTQDIEDMIVEEINDSPAGAPAPTKPPRDWKGFEAAASADFRAAKTYAALKAAGARVGKEQGIPEEVRNRINALYVELSKPLWDAANAQKTARAVEAGDPGPCARVEGCRLPDGHKGECSPGADRPVPEDAESFEGEQGQD